MSEIGMSQKDSIIVGENLTALLIEEAADIFSDEICLDVDLITNPPTAQISVL
jgi:hypothetical protein